ncbi:DEAD/DEAH box helicase [Domibacillus epiphyticus]|uniref:ATP-dependent helicase n=1 Tax=Domibacillus epiphyticus TaxID=1714355 RepID=A0A1V2AA15_9BACI|nr:SNF2-related protein [Domibacillus epiphyticus]OMP67692.1 ATP-dependent helicase [Domibacillus epiphyticus]
MKPPIIYDDSWEQQLPERVQSSNIISSWPLFKLTVETKKQIIPDDFHGLLTPSFLPSIDFLPHQTAAARTVMEEMNGTAILADEVGLGKTIEAGLILKEYMLRGLVSRALILTPASLVNQWARELREKCQIYSLIQKKNPDWSWNGVQIASIDSAKQPKNAEMIADLLFDMVIIDEAHRLKNPATLNYRFVRRLNKTYCLLLTATPVQNNVDELFHLVSLLKPGHFGSNVSFNTRFKSGKRSIQDQESFKALLQKVMIRNRRDETEQQPVKRFVETIRINPSPEEKIFYDALARLKDAVPNAMTLLTLQREACSSKFAALSTIQKLPGQEREEVSKLAEDITVNSKAEKAMSIIKKQPEKTIIFTQYRATQRYLEHYFHEQGIPAVSFQGNFKKGKKDWMVELFKGPAQVLIATESGSEGLNLQFCRRLINFDLPWNPMKLEQRIGRIHRFGQDQDVHIYHLAYEQSVEDRMLTLLHEKIHLFQSAIGKLDDILDQNWIEDHLHDAFHNSKSIREWEIKVHNLAAALE